MKEALVEVFGKVSVISLIAIKGLGFIGLVEVNNLLTVFVSLAGLFYMLFRGYNEFSKFKENQIKKRRDKDATKE